MGFRNVGNISARQRKMTKFFLDGLFVRVVIQTQPESALNVMSRKQSCCKNTLYNAVNSFEYESNPLTFWCRQRKKMPILAQIAATIFVMQASSAESASISCVLFASILVNKPPTAEAAPFVGLKQCMGIHFWVS